MIGKLTGEGVVVEEDVKKSIAFFGYKQWLLSLDMKTKVVQHVEIECERSESSESESFSSLSKHSLFPAFVWHSDIKKQSSITLPHPKISDRANPISVEPNYFIAIL